MIKFLDIYKQDKKIIKDISKEWLKIIKNSDFILGKKVKEFENVFSKYCDSKYAVGCANGTDAIYLALKSLNLPENSEVIVPAMTWCSTAFSVINANLKPILVDIEKNGTGICPESLKKTINRKTKAVIVVHLYGNCCKINEIKKVIGRKKIILIEDAAQAHGAKYYGKKVGSLGDLACFSFYPGKNLGAYGDAGAITTSNKKYYKKLLELRNMGSINKFIHNVVGVNSRLDTLQAVILLKKIKKLNYYNSKRMKIAKIYNSKINNTNVKKIKYLKNCVYHQYTILTKKRKRLEKLFKKNKIQYGFHYPVAIHQLRALKKTFKNKKFINAEQTAAETFSLPIDPNLTYQQISKICKTVNSL